MDFFQFLFKFGTFSPQRKEFEENIRSNSVEKHRTFSLLIFSTLPADRNSNAPPECSSIAAFFSFLFPLKDHFCIFKVSVLQLKNEKNFLLDSDDKKTGRCSFLGGAPELQFFYE